MKQLKLINVTIKANGTVTDKHGKTIKILPIEQRIERDKQKIKEYR